MNLHSKAVFILTICCLSACASAVTTLPPDTLEASLSQPCPALPILTQPTGKSVLVWGREVIRLYNLCAWRHDATVEAWPKR